MAKKQKSYELVSENWVSKSNVLNEVRNNKMTISQIRLFTIYLSKINPKNIASREVIFKLEEYTKIMQFKQTNTTRLVKTAEDLLGLTVKYFDKTGEYSSDGLTGFVVCQIFKRFKLYKSEEGEWLVSIDCHDDVVKLMFDLQKYYFKYQLWNALQLTSPNQQRMYELLKQYETIGERTFTVKDLRELLGIKDAEYPRWDNFKVRVLDASQESLKSFTDIKFIWEIAGKRGKGGKINAIKFNIERNNDYIRQLTLDDYLLEQLNPAADDEPEEFERPDEEYEKMIEYFRKACNNEFSYNQMVLLNDLLHSIGNVSRDYKDCFDYLKQKYNYLNAQGEKTTINDRFRYFKSLIELDDADHSIK
ncbi:MAG: replication initiation protein [Defluviitaleaceae bacterium]|nr:replication initiation protein [Defluviitaleaceae bacterium]